MFRIVLLALVLAGGIDLPWQTRGRAPDRQSSTPGAQLRGKVTAAATALPLRRAVVRATRNGAVVATALTGADGNYVLGPLEPGSYSISVTKPGYAPFAWGERGQMQLARPLVLRAGQRLDDIDAALNKGGVLAGVVIDENGEPAINAVARVHRVEYRGGRREIVALGQPDQTNDLGEFRLFGLLPGRYYVSARLGTPFGAMDPAGSGYVQTYYPSSPSVSTAEALYVPTGGVLSSLVITLASDRVASISGVALDADGTPFRGGFINVTSVGDAGRVSVTAGRLGEDGTFAIPNLPAGRYTLRADAPTSTRQPTPQIAVATVSINGADLQGVRLQAQRWVEVSARVTTIGTPPPSLAGMSLNVVRQHPDDPLDGMWNGGRVQTGSSFMLMVPPGTVHLRPAKLPPGWMLKSVKADGKDVTDEGLVLEPDAKPPLVEIEITNAVPHITGTVQRDNGEPVGDFAAVIFAEDPSHWTWNSRYIAMQRASAEGRFDFDSLPPGEYRIAAVEAVEDGQWRDPDFLRELLPDALSMTIEAGESKSLVVPLARVTPRPPD